MGAVKSKLIYEVCDLLAKLTQEAARQPAIHSLVLCALERAHGHEEQKESAKAERAFSDAIKMAGEEYGRIPSSDVARIWVQAEWELIETLQLRNEVIRAKAEIETFLPIIKRLAKENSQEVYIPITEAELHGIHAMLFDEKTQFQERLDSYDKAIARIDEAILLPRSSEHNLPLLRTMQSEWLAQAAKLHVDRNEFAQAVDRVHHAINIRAAIRWPDEEITTDVATNKINMVELYEGLAVLNVLMGRNLEARKAKQAAKEMVSEIAAQDQINPWIEKRIRELQKKLN